MNECQTDGRSWTIYSKRLPTQLAGSEPEHTSLEQAPATPTMAAA